MIKNPEESNIKLTDEQKAQLEVVQLRLSNFENEISIANKNLIVVKKEFEKATKDKLYQEETLKGLLETVKTLEEKKDELIEVNNTSITIFNETVAKTKELNESIFNQTTKIVEREKAIAQKEIDLDGKVEDFNIKLTQLLKDQVAVKTAKDAFLKANETITW